MVHGLLGLSYWGVFVALMIMTQISIAAVTIYLHRCQSHKSLTLHPVISHFFRFWLWLTTGMVTKQWVAIHRKHHAKCETKDDPHSPQIYGIKKVLLEGTELYRAEAKNQETLERFGRGTPDDWMERNVYSKHSAKGIILMLLIDLLCFGVIGLTVWAIQMIWMPFFAAGLVNGIGHFWGYRNSECADASRNVSPWGFFIGGEELHNNHHTFPGSAKLSLKWWEFDIGWFYIKTLSFLRLAKVHKVPPKLKCIPGKVSIDADTLGAVVSNRFQILSRYSKDVMLPVFRQERKRASNATQALFHRAKSLVIRENTDAKARKRLKALLAENKTLDMVYQYRERLQAIWNRTSANQKEMIEALQEWCRQAEATGIEALREFSARLRSYVPAPTPAAA